MFCLNEKVLVVVCIVHEHIGIYVGPMITRQVYAYSGYDVTTGSL